MNEIRFLEVELRDKYYSIYIKLCEMNSFSIGNFMEWYQLNLPKQTNLYDCGIYLLEYIESFFEEEKFNMQKLEKGDMNFKSLFSETIVEYKRQLLKVIIGDLRNRTVEEAVEKYKESRNNLFFDINIKISHPLCFPQRKKRKLGDDDDTEEEVLPQKKSRRSVKRPSN